MLPATYRRSIKNLLVVSAVGLSALFTLIAVFDVPSVQADRHEHVQSAAVIDTSPAQADHHEHAQLAAAINPSPAQVVQHRPAGPTSASAIVDVSIVEFAFQPAVITITAGTTVRWTNIGTITHTVTSDTSLWNSGDLVTGGVFSRTFAIPGTYDYHCFYHPTLMKGQVVVLPAGSEPPAAVSIAGPIEGAIDIAYAFTATVSPITTGLPITYFWQATGQSPITHAGGNVSDTIMFTWTSGTTGTQLITATATNAGGKATGTHVIIFNAHRIYLPLVLDSFGP